MADLLPDGFILIPFGADLDQAIFEPRYTFPKLWQICFQMVSFGHLSVQMWIRLFSNTDTPFQSYCRFASRWLALDTNVWAFANHQTIVFVERVLKHPFGTILFVPDTFSVLKRPERFGRTFSDVSALSIHESNVITERRAAAPRKLS